MKVSIFRRRLNKVLSFMLLACFSHAVLAYTYAIESDDDFLVGQTQYVRAEYADTLLDIARANGLGFSEIKLVNPDVDTWIPGTEKEILLPTEFILPHAPRDGIVLNIPEMRLYYFPRSKNQQNKTVITYPLGIGREGWGTPYVNTTITQKKKNPAWHPPASIRQEHEEKGDPLPPRVGPGPDNPLGDYAMRLGLPEYLIHGTNKPFGIGLRVSHGCIRLYPEDIEALFAKVTLGTPTYIVNQPFKLGTQNERIYLEAHPWLDEDRQDFQNNLTSIVRMLLTVTKGKEYELDWDLAKKVIAQPTGLPVEIGRFIPAEAVETPTDTASAATEPVGHTVEHTVGGDAPLFDLKLETEIAN